MRLLRTFLRPEWIIAALMTIAAIELHSKFWLHIGGLWRDEVNLMTLASRHSLAEMAKDSFPVLMPVTIHAWQAAGLGNNDLDLRILGLLVGVGMVGALWIASWKIRAAPPVLGLALFALNSSLIFFGDSLRAYGMGSLFAIALTASAFIFLQKPSVARMVWMIVFATLSVQLLYHNAVLVAAVCFGAWAVCWRRKDKRAAIQILLVAVVSAASLLPYFHSFVATASYSEVLRTGLSLSRFFVSYTDTLGYPRSWYIFIWIVLYAAMVVYACIGLLQRRDAPEKTSDTALSTDRYLFAAITLTLATVGFPLFFWRAQMPMQSWYVLPFMACAAVCFDAVLPALNCIGRTIVLIFAAATACMSVPATSALLDGHFSNVNMYARELTAFASPDDYIIVDPWHFGITFNYYFKGATHWDTLPPISEHSTHRFDLVQQQMENTNAIAPVLRHIAQTLSSGHRVWILAGNGWMGVPPRGAKPPATLAAAPLPDTGWADWPYTRVWAAQVACFTMDHSREFGQLKGLSNDRFITEDMVLFAADGWNTNAIAP